MNRNTLLGFVVGLLAGVLAGYIFWGTNHVPAPDAVSPMASAPVGAPPAMAGVEAMSRIPMAEQAVRQDPKNVRAWVQLGNDYFDTQQFQKSVDAYQKALDLDPRNPDVLTDQGVMYRALGQFPKAVENFKKAQQVDPKHQQSLWNLGVVYAHDLHQPKLAREAWTRMLALEPSGPQSAQVREALADLDKAPGAAPAPAKR
ncbi:MAG TPA: tetratricopeptide repeat protein [Anaeromyxobacteraceae bacterium]|nr:tetratricopeptide repeat protein [Anaeromyxobacteraceae bacterium]